METQEVLTSEELYLSEVRCLPRLTYQEEQEIIRHARNGDDEARADLLKSCLNYVGWIASLYVRYVFHDDYLDLVGVGNTALVEHLDEALTRDNPYGYLRARAKYAIIYYCFNNASLIPVPWHYRQRYRHISVVSIDAPKRDGRSLHDKLEDHPPAVPITHDYSWLYEAVEQLPRHYQETLRRHYGLYETRPESLYQLSRMTKANVKGTWAYLIEYRALRRLRQLLAQQEGATTFMPYTQKKASALS